MKVYLCGPINGCSDDEAMTWREWFKNNAPAGMSFVDPMRRDYRGRESTDYREVVVLDKRDVAGCDVLVVLYSKPSVGTAMEVLYAWMHNKPAIVIDESSKPLSPWLLYHASAIVGTREDARRKLLEWAA